MALFGSSWKEEDDEDQGKPGFGSFRSPSFKEKYQQLTGDLSENLSKQDMIDRLENNINQGFESLRVLGKMSELKANINDSLK